MPVFIMHIVELKAGWGLRCRLNSLGVSGKDRKQTYVRFYWKIRMLLAGGKYACIQYA